MLGSVCVYVCVRFCVLSMCASTLVHECVYRNLGFVWCVEAVGATALTEKKFDLRRKFISMQIHGTQSLLGAIVRLRCFVLFAAHSWSSSWRRESG